MNESIHVTVMFYLFFLYFIGSQVQSRIVHQMYTEKLELIMMRTIWPVLLLNTALKSMVILIVNFKIGWYLRDTWASKKYVLSLPDPLTCVFSKEGRSWMFTAFCINLIPIFLRMAYSNNRIYPMLFMYASCHKISFQLFSTLAAKILPNRGPPKETVQPQEEVFQWAQTQASQVNHPRHRAHLGVRTLQGKEGHLSQAAQVWHASHHR